MQLWGLLATPKRAGWLSRWKFQQELTLQSRVPKQRGSRILSSAGTSAFSLKALN